MATDIKKPLPNTRNELRDMNFTTYCCTWDIFAPGNIPFIKEK